MPLLAVTLFLACHGEPAPAPDAPSGTAAAPPPGMRPALGPDGKPLPGRPPPGSGGTLQDPSGFPSFHQTPPPPGPAPAIDPQRAASEAVGDPELGGFRPQIAVGPDDSLHVVYYNHHDSGDILWYRRSLDGVRWSAPEQVSASDGRNWGPDLVVRNDGRVFVVWDRAESDFRSRGWLRERGPDGWNEAVPLTEDGPREVGSGHIAVVGEDVAYVYIGKELGMEHRFRAYWRWRHDGTWSKEQAWTDGTQDAWHTNVQAAPDGSVIAGYDVGVGGSETTTFVVAGRDGRFDAPENLRATSQPGERVHFGFGGGNPVWLAWFHKREQRPLHVYVRGGRPGAWGPTTDLAQGYGGYHYDPFVAVNRQGVPAVVWGWDGGSVAELLLSTFTGGRWSAPLQVGAVGKGKPELPSMDVDSAGRYHLAWSQGERGRTQVYVTTVQR